jgi:hypothetical protein
LTKAGHYPTLALAVVFVLAVMASLSTPSFASSAGCTLVGSTDADVLKGTRRDDVICGRGGNDVIRGLNGDDRLIGGSGSDRLIGGRGDDTLIGGAGEDVLRGGPGQNACPDASASVKQGCPTSRRPLPPPLPAVGPAPSQPPLSVPDEPDLAPPEISKLQFGRESVEVGYGDWWVEVDVAAWDSSGIEAIDLTIQGPAGVWREVALGPGPEMTEATKRLDVPASTPVGTYAVSEISVVDRAGNSVTHDRAWLEANGLSAHFEIYDGPDREPPTLAGLRFEPTPVDTSGGPVTVEVPIEANDAGLGIKRVRLVIEHPTSKPGAERVYVSEPDLASGTAREGTWLATIPLPGGSRAGFYPVQYLELEDFDHHWAVFNAESLQGDNFPGGFSQAGAGDTTKPTITSFSISPQVIHTDADERLIEVEIGASDDWSGVADWPDPVARVSFQLTPPGWPISWGMSGSFPELISGSDHEGVWRIKRWLDADAPFGTYTVRWISVTDRAGNTRRLEDAALEEFEAGGWDLSFENLPNSGS